MEIMALACFNAFKYRGWRKPRRA